MWINDGRRDGANATPVVLVVLLLVKNGTNAETLLHNTMLCVFDNALLQSYDRELRHDTRTIVELTGLQQHRYGTDGTIAADPAPGKGRVMSVILRRDILAREVARRGWTLADLAKAAGVSAATVTAAMAGRPVSPRSLQRIAVALASAPPLANVDELLLG